MPCLRVFVLTAYRRPALTIPKRQSLRPDPKPMLEVQPVPDRPIRIICNMVWPRIPRILPPLRRYQVASLKANRLPCLAVHHAGQVVADVCRVVRVEAVLGVLAGVAGLAAGVAVAGAGAVTANAVTLAVRLAHAKAARLVASRLGGVDGAAQLWVFAGNALYRPRQA